MYFPVPAHRGAWTGDAGVLVGTIGADGTVPVAFTTDGRRITLDPQSPPTTPVLAVVPRETDFSAPRPRTRAFMTCVECDGGGSGGTSGGGSTSTGAVPPPPGLYLRGSHLNDLFESWLKGKPEIEILLLGQKGQTDSLTSYQCINENAVAPYTFNQDTKDWTGSVLLMSQAQVDNFKASHPDQALRLFMVEDDDTPCVIKANQTDLKALIQAVDALVKGLAGGKDVSTWIGKVWKAVPVVQQIVALGSSLIKTNDDLVGNAVEDITTTERQAGYNWVVKGKNTETNGYLAHPHVRHCPARGRTPPGCGPAGPLARRLLPRAGVVRIGRRGRRHQLPAVARAHDQCRRHPHRRTLGVHARGRSPAISPARRGLEHGDRGSGRRHAPCRTRLRRRPPAGTLGFSPVRGARALPR
jgi:hypothetical protein